MMELSNTILPRYLEANATRNPDKAAILYQDDQYTWKDVDDLSAALSCRMEKLGITRGTHVGIFGTNHPNWILVFLAAERLGAIPVAINTCYKQRELTSIVSYSDCACVYYGQGYKNTAYEPLIREVSDQTTGVKQWIPMGEKGWKRSDFTAEELSSDYREKLLEHEDTITSEDIAAMLFTSGTTAQSKGVLLTYRNLVNTALTTIRCMRWTSDDRLCLSIPLFHCFGVTSSLFSTVILGSAIAPVPYYRSVWTMETIARYHCTIFNGVPSMFLALVKNPAFDQYDLSSLRSGIIAGSAIYPADFHMLSEKLPQMNLIPSYGLTETSPAVTFSLWDDPVEVKAQNCGKVVDGVECRIISLQDGKPVKAEDTGEVEVRGYNIMKGYYKKPEETAKALEKDGWLHTGDLGYFDQQGYLYLKGRCKETIIRGGENISPSEIEDVIKECPWISEVCVLGVPAPVILEKVVACVILEKGTDLRENELRAHLSKALADYKIPEQFYIFDEFPKTSSGKIKREELKKQLLRRIAGKTGKEDSVNESSGT